MLIVMVLIGLCVVLTASSVSAASTVYVNATGGNDSNAGTIDHPYQTIGQGIGSVDENGTVQIADGIYAGTGNTNLTINKNVNITGQSQKGTIINGTNINWIFTIISGVTVNIQNLTVTNAKGCPPGDMYDFRPIWNYAAINNYGTINSLSGCTFTGNTAEAGAGVIDNMGGTINSLSGCTFTGNTGPYGGAICNVDGGTLIISNCTFTNNSATEGGAINNNVHCVCTVKNCTFTNNSALTGGAILNTAHATLTVENSNFKNNTATDNSMGFGGAIYNDSGPIVAHFNSFVGNTASDWGNAIYNADGSLNATDNWWGSNNPVWADLIANYFGTVDTSTWLYMTINPTATTINNTQTSLVTVSFNNRYNGTTVTSFDPSAGHIPDGTLVTYISTLGSFNPVTAATVNGIATSLFTASHAGTGNLTATTNTQTVKQLLTVNPVSYLYLNTKTSKKNPTAGETFVITYKLSNSGPDNATNVTMSFQIPAGLEFVTASVDNGTWTYNPANRTVTWTLDNVAVGDPYLYLTVKALGTGSYTIIPTITSKTFNRNSNPLTPFNINVQAENNSNGNTVNAASTTKTVPMQTTGMPIAGLVLAILAVLGGIFTPRKK